MTSLMVVSAMCVQLIITVETLPAEATLRMPLETTLIDRAGIVVSKLLVLAQILLCKELMLVCKDLLVPGAQVTHNLLMNTSHMSMQVGPSQACDIAVVIRTIVAK
jgi:hypothetical protein